MNKLLTTALAGGALVGAAAVGGVAGAATTPSTSAPATGHHAAGRTWLKAHHRHLRRAGLDASAKAIGITPAELRTDLRGGTSVAAVANAHSVSTDTLVGDLVKAADARINAAVTAGTLTQTRATTIEQRLPTFVTRVVNHTFGTHAGSGSTTSTTAG